MSLRSKLVKVGLPILAAASINACQWVSAPKPLPDLAVKEIYVNEGEWINGYKGSITGVIANLGDAPTGPFEVTASGLEGKITVDGGIEPGKTVPLEFYVNLPQGKYSIFINADPDKKVNEKDEYNNQLSIDTLPVFEFISDIASAEQNKVYHDNALEDYRKVLDVYGINEKDARMIVSIGQQGYGIGFYYNGKDAGAFGLGPDDFVTDRREVRHEMGHAINDTLFPTYHTWFDEGLSMYVSGEIETSIELAKNEGRMDELTEKVEKLISDPESYWDERAVGLYTHAVGWEFYRTLIIKEDLTKEANRNVLNSLREMYLTGGEPTRAKIQEAFETGLDVEQGYLDYLFNALKPAIIKYSSDPKVTNDFLIS